MQRACMSDWSRSAMQLGEASLKDELVRCLVLIDLDWVSNA